MTKVAVIKADAYDTKVVDQAMQELLSHLGGIEKYIDPGDRVLIKPNMLEAADKASGITTHPEVVRAVIREVKKAGGISVVGDSPGLGSTLRVAEKCGILEVCQQENVELLDFNESVEVKYPQGEIVKNFALAKACLNVDKVISVAKMKTHSFMVVTGAVKNLFGLFVGHNKAQFHLRMKKMSDFAHLLVDLQQYMKPCLAIIDGISGMEGAGPRNGDKIHCGILLASDNSFAVDLVMADKMGFAAEQLPVSIIALQQGLVPSLSMIDVVGSASQVQFQFKKPRTVENLENRIPGWVVRLGQNQLTARPHINERCIGCGRCAEHCPPKTIEIRNRKAVIDYRNCIRCYCCQELCPENAVVLKEGILLRLLHRLG
ncbi:DUF362 domain-containing protein [Anaerosinus massiliensis]|uniref:DUF362 domain-containing protein n=1 Tax=Massilibacillus massiliensis TaxID=1806837 RepID=UPI000B02951A|nr:DUF362 domain-containing protein [Massilibacillus massiliensis]